MIRTIRARNSQNGNEHALDIDLRYSKVNLIPRINFFYRAMLQ